LGRELELAPFMRRLASEAWAEPGIAVLEGRLSEAATLYERLGAKAEAARAWLADGEAAAAERRPEAEPSLRRAAELWRRIRAPRGTEGRPASCTSRTRRRSRARTDAPTRGPRGRWS